MILQVLKLVLASYLLVLALGLVMGFGRPLLRWPWRSVYLFLRLSVLGLSLGKVKLTPLAARSSVGIRQFPELVRGWNMDRKDEAVLARGQDLEVGDLSWVSRSPEAPVENSSNDSKPSFPSFSQD